MLAMIDVRVSVDNGGVVKLVRKPGDAQQLAGAGSLCQLHLVDGTDQSSSLAPAKSTFDLLAVAEDDSIGGTVLVPRHKARGGAQCG